MGLGAAFWRLPSRATAGNSMEAPSVAPTALAVSRMNRRRDTAALGAVWPSSNGEEIVWLADLRAKRDAARPDGNWGFITKRDPPRPRGSCQASNGGKLTAATDIQLHRFAGPKGSGIALEFLRRAEVANPTPSWSGA